MHHLCNSPGHERRALILCRHFVRQVKEQGVHGRGHRAFIFCRWRRFHGGFYYILVSKEGCSYPSVHLQPEVIKKCSSLHQFPKSGVWEQSKTIPQISKNRITSAESENHKRLSARSKLLFFQYWCSGYNKLTAVQKKTPKKPSPEFNAAKLVSRINTRGLHDIILTIFSVPDLMSQYRDDSIIRAMKVTTGGSVTLRFACNGGSVSPETYEDQLRPSSDVLKRHGSIPWVSTLSISVWVSAHVCVLVGIWNQIGWLWLN